MKWNEARKIKTEIRMTFFNLKVFLKKKIAKAVEVGNK